MNSKELTEEKLDQMNCSYCPIQDSCLEFYNKVLILHDYIDERNCPYKELVKGELL